MTLAVNINRLTRAHLTTGPNGKPITVPSLLDQLDQAVGDKRGGAGASGGSALPISTAAVSLRQDIEREAREHQREMERFTEYPLIGILQSWATIEGEWCDFLEHVTQDWADQIGNLVAPVKPPRRLHQPCPACGILYGGDDMKPGLQVHCWGEDEGMLPPGDWTAECVHCGAGWQAGDMSWLVRSVNVAS